MENKHEILIITGAAPCCMDDVAALSELISISLAPSDSTLESVSASIMGLESAFDWMAIGYDAVDKYDWPIKYFATYHPSEIEMSMERRAKAGGNTDCLVIAHQQHPAKEGHDLVNMIIPCEPPSGSSSLLGVLAGIKYGYKKIILCGCPLTGKNDKEYDYAHFRAGWTAKMKEIKDVTRSMSGWTRDILGAVDKEWLEH